MLNVKIFVISHTLQQFKVQYFDFFLSQVIKSSESAGTLPRDWFDIPAGELGARNGIVL